MTSDEDRRADIERRLRLLFPNGVPHEYSMVNVGADPRALDPAQVIEREEPGAHGRRIIECGHRSAYSSHRNPIRWALFASISGVSDGYVDTAEEARAYVVDGTKGKSWAKR